MTRSELIKVIAARFELYVDDIEMSVTSLIDLMSKTLSEGNRIEIRGFGSFSLHHRLPRTARNPKNGESVSLGSKSVPHFKPGKELRLLVDG